MLRFQSLSNPECLSAPKYSRLMSLYSQTAAFLRAITTMSKGPPLILSLLSRKISRILRFRRFLYTARESTFRVTVIPSRLTLPSRGDTIITKCLEYNLRPDV